MLTHGNNICLFLPVLSVSHYGMHVLKAMLAGIMWIYLKCTRAVCLVKPGGVVFEGFTIRTVYYTWYCVTSTHDLLLCWLGTMSSVVLLILLFSHREILSWVPVNKLSTRLIGTLVTRTESTRQGKLAEYLHSINQRWLASLIKIEISMRESIVSTSIPFPEDDWPPLVLVLFFTNLFGCLKFIVYILVVRVSGSVLLH